MKTMARWSGFALFLIPLLALAACDSDEQRSASPTSESGATGQSSASPTSDSGHPGALVQQFDASGNEQWHAALPAQAGAMVASGGRVFVEAADGKLYALDGKDGHGLWTIDVRAKLAADGDAVVLENLVPANGQNGLTLLDAATGKTRWEAPLDEDVFDFVLTSDVIVAIGRDLIALDRGSGVERWRLSLPDDEYAAPEADGDQVLIHASYGEIRALDLRTGTERWRANPGRPWASDVIEPLSPDGGRLYAMLSDAVVALDGRDGHEVWRQRVTFRPSDTYEFFLRAARGVTVLSDGDRLRGFDSASGSALWSDVIDLGPEAGCGCTVHMQDGLLLIGGTTKLRALDARSGKEAWSTDVLLPNHLAAGDAFVVASVASARDTGGGAR